MKDVQKNGLGLIGSSCTVRYNLYRWMPSSILNLPFVAAGEFSPTKKRVPKDLENVENMSKGLNHFNSFHSWFVIMYPSRQNLPKIPNHYLPSEEV